MQLVVLLFPSASFKYRLKTCSDVIDKISISVFCYVLSASDVLNLDQKYSTVFYYTVSDGPCTIIHNLDTLRDLILFQPSLPIHLLPGFISLFPYFIPLQDDLDFKYCWTFVSAFLSFTIMGSTSSHIFTAPWPCTSQFTGSSTSTIRSRRDSCHRSRILYQLFSNRRTKRITFSYFCIWLRPVRNNSNLECSNIIPHGQPGFNEYNRKSSGQWVLTRC